jgi:uncharacterized protein YgiM (DUF1202 family)
VLASPVPSATATPPAVRNARIVNTGGLGLNIRREPAGTAAAVAAVAEGTTVRVIGPEQQGPDGRAWVQVEDARGNQGWVLADFLMETE